LQFHDVLETNSAFRMCLTQNHSFRVSYTQISLNPIKPWAGVSQAALGQEEEPPDPLRPSRICLVPRGSVSPSCSQTRRPWPRWSAPAWGPLSAGFLYRCSRTWRRWPVTRQADVASVPRSRAEALANRPWPRWPAPLCCAGGGRHGSLPPPPRPPLAPVVQTVAAFSRHLLIALDAGPDDHCLRPHHRHWR